jgi:hypothetical protein
MQSQSFQSGNHAKVIALRKKHAEIENRIQEAQKRPSTASDYMNQLKKKKLILKDTIEKIEKSSVN